MKKTKFKEIELLQYLIKNQNKRFNIKAYSNLIDFPRSTIYDIIKRLELKDLIYKIKEGDYRINNKGKKFILKEKKNYRHNLIKFKLKIDEDDYISKLKDLNQICYFCDFDIIIHKHHIISKKDGGSEKEDNKIGLCPNHHSMIHNRDFCLYYSKGYYYMFDKNRKIKILKPTKIQLSLKRKLPKIKRAIVNEFLWVNTNE